MVKAAYMFSLDRGSRRTECKACRAAAVVGRYKQQDRAIVRADWAATQARRQARKEVAEARRQKDRERRATEPAYAEARRRTVRNCRLRAMGIDVEVAS